MYHLAFSYRVSDLGISEKMAAGTITETSRTVSRKRNNSSDSVMVSKKRKKSPNHYLRSHENQVNSMRTVLTTTSSEDSSKERSRANHKPGPKSRVRPQEVSINDTLNQRSKVNELEQDNKVKHKCGPESWVAGKNDDLDGDNSDVEFVLHKPPNVLLDVIDLTDAVDSPVEGEDGSDPKETLTPHILLTKIPGICNIYTCSLCEGTFTSASYANRHLCMVNRLIPISPTEVELGEKMLGEEPSKNKVPGEMTSDDKTKGKRTSEGAAAEHKAEGKRTSEGIAAGKKAEGKRTSVGIAAGKKAEGKHTSESIAKGQKATEKKVHESDERHNAGSISSEDIFSASSNLSSESQRILSETKGAETGNNCSENDTSSAGVGSHFCDICGIRCTRLVSLASHKDRHLYPMNECENSCDSMLFNVRKKKKRPSKPMTENE
jgi:hypothetical protein